MKIYILQEDNSFNFKIGITKNNLDKRINQLSTGNSSKISKVWEYESKYASQIEKTLHRILVQFTTPANNEWFHVEDKNIMYYVQEIYRIEEHLIFLEENKIHNNEYSLKIKI